MSDASRKEMVRQIAIDVETEMCARVAEQAAIEFAILNPPMAVWAKEVAARIRARIDAREQKAKGKA